MSKNDFTYRAVINKQRRLREIDELRSLYRAPPIKHESSIEDTPDAHYVPVLAERASETESREIAPVTETHITYDDKKCDIEEVSLKTAPEQIPCDTEPISTEPEVCSDNELEDECGECGEKGQGLLYYRKWWELSEVDIMVGGKLLTGIPIFVFENTLRVVNDDFSYFIPLEKIDYIRTTDGLRADNWSESKDYAEPLPFDALRKF